MLSLLFFHTFELVCKYKKYIIKFIINFNIIFNFYTYINTSSRIYLQTQFLCFAIKKFSYLFLKASLTEDYLYYK